MVTVPVTDGTDWLWVSVSVSDGVPVSPVVTLIVGVKVVVGVLVEKAGAVLVGTLGTLSVCPALMTSLLRQLACLNIDTVMR